ncbi:unnamed protein product [Soboliphyme baturini]|uniref:FH2 domain-containing protein n=1 Tax=Soboliphyme baturini TaxID=241478 RepID=A0A183J4L9_9BILA|nr:unnamed protein product [Soboliphyme baturini]
MSLPLSFVAYYSLAPLLEKTEGQHFEEFYDNVRAKFIAVIDVRRSLFRQRLSSSRNKVTESFPENALQFVIHILSHCSVFKAFDDAESLKQVGKCLWFALHPFTVKSAVGVNYDFMYNLFQAIKQTQDPDSESRHDHNKKMWSLCDLALLYLNNRCPNITLGKSAQGHVRLSQRFFKQFFKTEKNVTVYLPQSLIDDEVMRKTTEVRGRISNLSESSKENFEVTDSAIPAAEVKSKDKSNFQKSVQLNTLNTRSAANEKRRGSTSSQSTELRVGSVSKELTEPMSVIENLPRSTSEVLDERTSLEQSSFKQVQVYDKSQKSMRIVIERVDTDKVLKSLRSANSFDSQRCSTGGVETPPAGLSPELTLVKIDTEASFSDAAEQEHLGKHFISTDPADSNRSSLTSQTTVYEESAVHSLCSSRVLEQSFPKHIMTMAQRHLMLNMKAYKSSAIRPKRGLAKNLLIVPADLVEKAEESA